MGYVRSKAYMLTSMYTVTVWSDSSVSDIE